MLGCGRRQTLVVRELGEYVRQMLGPGESLEHHRDDVFLFFYRLGNLPAHPVIFVFAPVKAVCGEYEYKVFCSVDYAYELLVEFSRVHGFQVKKYPVSGRTQFFDYGESGFVSTVATVRYEDVVCG